MFSFVLSYRANFRVGNTINSETRGIWAAVVRGPSGVMLLLDTEGLNSTEANAQHDAQIFSLAIMLSTLLIYNLKGTINESALNEMGMVSEITRVCHSVCSCPPSVTNTDYYFHTHRICVKNAMPLVVLLVVIIRLCL